MIARRPLLLGAAAAGLAGPSAFAQTGGDFVGAWNGVLEAGSVRLRLRLVVAEGEATLFSLDQGGAAIAGADLHIDGDRIRVAFPSIRASYDGRLIEGRISGTFTQGAALPLVFARGEAQAAPAPVEALTQARLEALRGGAGVPALTAAGQNATAYVCWVDGVRENGRAERASEHDKWHLGSITKSMTATLVAKSVEAGAVSWDDTVGLVLGAAIPEMRAEYRDVNFRHLLSHRAGLQANIDVADLLRFPRENADPRSDRIAYARLGLQQAPAGPKETTFEYSNTGYVIAGAMLEAKLGAPWETLMREHVFSRHDMRSMGFGAPGAAGAHDQPVGHAAGLLGRLSAHPPGSALTDNPAVLGPAGRVHGAMEDVLFFLTAHCRRQLLLERRESWDMLHTPPFGGEYAMGWLKRPDGLWHNGSNTLWYAEVMFDPARGVAAAAAANDGRAQARPAVGAALLGAAAALV